MTVVTALEMVVHAIVGVVWMMSFRVLIFCMIVVIVARGFAVEGVHCRVVVSSPLGVYDVSVRIHILLAQSTFSRKGALAIRDRHGVSARKFCWLEDQNKKQAVKETKKSQGEKEEEAGGRR